MDLHRWTYIGGLTLVDLHWWFTNLNYKVAIFIICKSRADIFIIDKNQNKIGYVAAAPALLPQL